MPPPHLPNYLFEVKTHPTTTRNKSIPKIIPTPSNYILYILTSGVLCFFLGESTPCFGGGDAWNHWNLPFLPHVLGSQNAVGPFIPSWLPFRRSSCDWQNVGFLPLPLSQKTMTLVGWDFKRQNHLKKKIESTWVLSIFSKSFGRGNLKKSYMKSLSS